MKDQRKGSGKTADDQRKGSGKTVYGQRKAVGRHFTVKERQWQDSGKIKERRCDLPRPTVRR